MPQGQTLTLVLRFTTWRQRKEKQRALSLPWKTPEPQTRTHAHQQPQEPVFTWSALKAHAYGLHASFHFQQSGLWERTCALGAADLTWHPVNHVVNFALEETPVEGTPKQAQHFKPLIS